MVKSPAMNLKKRVCPFCHRVLVTAAAMFCACGGFVSAYFHQDNEDEPAARTPAHVAQAPSPARTGPPPRMGYGAPVESGNVMVAIGTRG